MPLRTWTCKQRRAATRLARERADARAESLLRSRAVKIYPHRPVYRGRLLQADWIDNPRVGGSISPRLKGLGQVLIYTED